MERLIIEHTVRSNILGLLHFMLLVVCFLECLESYDPSQAIAAVNTRLRKVYGMDELGETIRTPGDVIGYMANFLDVTYGMASALVDANTLNSIDPMRCFKLDTTDVCRLSYWEVQSRRKIDEHYVNLSAMFRDELSLMNLNHSRMDCRAPDPKENCLHWDRRIDPDIQSAVVGLTPEEPVIVEDRKTFPFAQVVPLSPIVWQTRSPKVACSGFGDTYNTQILGAGRCTPKSRCELDEMTSFNGPVPNPQSDRIQSIFVAYENNAFNCLDRSKEDGAGFYDKSWDPWASYSDLTVGRRLEPAILLGKSVYYKFISDVSYLMAPIKGTVYINKTDACQPCEEWSSPDCTDPLEVGPSHPMWSERSISDTCSIRRKWIKRYLNNEQTPDRESTFFTPQTTEISIAALVITPQMASLPDITTLVTVKMVRGQHGAISARPAVYSISETPVVRWCSWCGITILLALLFPIHELRKRRRHACGFLGADVCLVIAVCVYIGYNMYLEFSPPHVLQELLEAFDANQQEAYFSCFAGLMAYASGLHNLKNAGFYLLLALFLRLLILLDVHPRLGILVQVARKCADDTFHFMLQFTIQYAMLSYLAFWSFGESRAEFSSFSWSAYTLFRYFVGEFEFPEKPPGSRFVVFLILYVFVISVMMVNFLLAIVVNAHTKVTSFVEENQTEQNAIMDFWDVGENFIMFLRQAWPSPGQVLEYLVSHIQHGQSDMLSLPAVTAKELVGSKLFTTEESAQEFIDHYAQKMNCVLEETRAEMRFPQGHCFLEETNGHVGSEPLLVTASWKECKDDETVSEVLLLRRQLLQSRASENKLQNEVWELRRALRGSQWGCW